MCSYSCPTDQGLHQEELWHTLQSRTVTWMNRSSDFCVGIAELAQMSLSGVSSRKKRKKQKTNKTAATSCLASRNVCQMHVTEHYKNEATVGRHGCATTSELRAYTSSTSPKGSTVASPALIYFHIQRTTLHLFLFFDVPKNRCVEKAVSICYPSRQVFLCQRGYHLSEGSNSRDSTSECPE